MTHCHKSGIDGKCQKNGTDDDGYGNWKENSGTEDPYSKIFINIAYSWSGCFGDLYVN